MAFNILEFRSVIMEKGVLTPNRFHVRINMPPGLVGVGGSDSYQIRAETVRTMEFWAEACDEPAYSISTHDMKRYGIGTLQKRPTFPVLQDVTITFISDGNATIQSFFEEWMGIICNMDMSDSIIGETGEVRNQGVGNLVNYTPFEVGYKDEYAVDVTITKFDLEGEPVKSFILREAFPVAVGGAQLSWQDNNSYLKFPVKMTYSDFFTRRILETDEF